MLQTIRDRLTGWIAVLILVVIGLALAISFGTTGSDVVGRGYAAKVNGEEIPVSEFRTVYQNQLVRQQEMLQSEVDAWRQRLIGELDGQDRLEEPKGLEHPHPGRLEHDPRADSARLGDRRVDRHPVAGTRQEDRGRRTGGAAADDPYVERSHPPTLPDAASPAATKPERPADSVEASGAKARSLRSRTSPAGAAASRPRIPPRTPNGVRDSPGEASGPKRARSRLGMVKEGEEFYQVVEE